MNDHEPNEAYLQIGYGSPGLPLPEDPSPVEPPIVLPPDLRPWWAKMTNIGILIVAVAGTLAPALAELGYTRAAVIVAAIAGLGVTLGLKGSARRSDAIRTDLIDSQERSEP